MNKSKLIILITIIISGCADRFGYSIERSLVSVSSTPPNAIYYTIPQKLFNLLGIKYKINYSGEDFEVIQKKLSDFQQDMADGSSWKLLSGDYVFIVACGNHYEAIRKSIDSTSTISINFSCTR